MATHTFAFVRQYVAGFGEDRLEGLSLRVTDKHTAKEHQHCLEASKCEREMSERPDLMNEEGEDTRATQLVRTSLAILDILGVTGRLICDTICYREIITFLTLLLIETLHAIRIDLNFDILI